MLYILIGIAAFGLYAIYDINSVRWKKKAPAAFFFLGSLLLLGATVLGLVQTCMEGAIRPLPGGLWVLFAALAALSFALMIYTLFFALPFQETYVEPVAPGKVCDRGMYALCRHPGVIWFCLGYLNLALLTGSGLMWGMGTCFGLLNIAYAVFQDRWTFLRTFEDYDGYRKRVPFLIPTKESIRRAWQTR